jgi:hypothetical protein
MAIHGTDGAGAYCGQPGDVICVGWDKFRQRMADWRYRDALCQKCKRWVRSALAEPALDRSEPSRGSAGRKDG